MSDENVDIEPNPRFCSKTSCIQLMYGIWVNMASLTFGMAYGFPAIQIPQLNSPKSNILVSMDEGSWIASVFMLFCPIGCLISGYMIDKFGRRIPLLSCQIPMCIGWIFTGTAQSALSIIIGRAVTGVGCGMGLGVPRLYTSEISLVNMRGLLGALPNNFLSLGITLQAAMGSYIDWQNLCYVCSSLNVLLLLSYILLRESPYFLLVHATENKARHALTYFRSKSYPVDKEMSRLIKFKQEHDIRSLNKSEKIRAIFSNASCKPFGIIMTYIAFVCLSGVPIVTIWTINLLLLTNSTYDVYAGNFIIAITRLIFGTIATCLLFYIGRRPMALISASGVASSSLIMGFFFSNSTNPSAAPQIFFMVFMAFASLGYQYLPFLLMSEMYPLQVRGILIGISLTLTNLMIFTSIKYFPYLHEAVGISNTLLIFGCGSSLASIFLYFSLPETKGMTLQEIEEYFKGHRSTHILDRSASK